MIKYMLTKMAQIYIAIRFSFLFFFNACTHSIWKTLGQGLNPCCHGNLSHYSQILNPQSHSRNCYSY